MVVSPHSMIFPEPSLTPIKTYPMGCPSLKNEAPPAEKHPPPIEK